jgi:hypothetical protein
LFARHFGFGKKDQKIISDAQTKNNELQVRLDDRERRRQVRGALGNFLEEGRQLMIRCTNESLPEPTADAEAWSNTAETFFQQNMDDSFIARFRDDSGLPMTATSIASNPHRNLWAGIRVRTSRLQEFIMEYHN